MYGKGVNCDTEPLETLRRELPTEILRQTPPVPLGAFPLVMGRSPGRG